MSVQLEALGVNNAVEHLQELADRMTTDFGFSENDVLNIDLVVEALRELEALRHDAHERLEAETIRASIQRHKLQFLPQKISKEIYDAVCSARQSNADALEYLKKRLDKINANIIYLEELQKRLDEENAVLHPEREMIREQHEEIISQLNQRMAEKASMQIHLNETRDQVRQTNQDIVDLEDGILQLKEDLIHERGEARTEKRQLKKAVANTSDKTKEQKVLNIHKKEELDSLHSKLEDSEAKLDNLRKSLRRYETSKAKLEGQERALTAQLQKQLKQNEELKRKGTNIINEDIKLQREFTENEKQMTKKLKRLENEIERETLRYDELDQQRTVMSEELAELVGIREIDAEHVASLDEELQAQKNELAMKAEEVGRLQGENIDMQEEIENLGESHKALETELRHLQGIRTPTPPPPPGLSAEEQAALELMGEEERAAVLAQLNKQIEDYRKQLAKERAERFEVQERKNSKSKELEDYKQENQKYMQEMNKTITTGKAEHITLSNEEDVLDVNEQAIQELHDLEAVIVEESEDESDYDSDVEEDTPRGAQLQKELREDESVIKGLEDRLQAEQTKYQDAFSKQQSKVDGMEREILDMENSIAERTQKISDITPGFEALEKAFDERTEAYEKQKKSIVELKTKKTQLEERIRKAKTEKEKMITPQEKLRKDLKQKRHEVIFQIKHHSEETKVIETEIYESGCKLKAVMDENSRFQEACDKMSGDMEDLQDQIDHNELLKKRLLEELSTTKAALESSWSEDHRIQQQFGDRDQEVVDEFGNLLERTGLREEKISHITEQLEVELGNLTSFLDNLSSRRPKDSYMSRCRTATPMTPGTSLTSRKPLSFRLSRREKTFESGKSTQSSKQPKSSRSSPRYGGGSQSPDKYVVDAPGVTTSDVTQRQERRNIGGSERITARFESDNVAD